MSAKPPTKKARARLRKVTREVVKLNKRVTSVAEKRRADVAGCANDQPKES